MVRLGIWTAVHASQGLGVRINEVIIQSEFKYFISIQALQNRAMMSIDKACTFAMPDNPGRRNCMHLLPA